MNKIDVSSAYRRPTGTDAKARRGAGWGGKGSSNISQYGQGARRRVPYQSDHGCTNWMGRTLPHQGVRECLRRRAGGMRYAEQRLFFDALPASEDAA